MFPQTSVADLSVASYVDCEPFYVLEDFLISKRRLPHIYPCMQGMQLGEYIMLPYPSWGVLTRLSETDR
jgi:hypothetical protein